jgi:N-acetyltransferase
MNDLWTDNVILNGQKLRMEPLELRHVPDLARNLLKPGAWHSEHWGTRTESDIMRNTERTLLAQASQLGIGFAMVLQKSGEAVGISHYMNLNRKNSYLEIGGTWVGQGWQKSFVNTEAKLLMLGHAFEKIGCQRVEFRIDSLNFNSQRAVLRLGAKYEGELRQSMTLPDGRKRDYKVYSVLDNEWTSVKRTLHWYLEKYV